MTTAMTVVDAPASRAADVLLEARGLTAGYGSGPVIHDIDLTVRAGEVVTLLGANGAGKTTTLLTLAGDITPLGGSLAVVGDPRRQRLHQRARKGLGLLTEERCVFMDLTGWQNLRLGRGSVQDAVAYFPELEPHLGKRAGLLSGGQQQMLALARVLAGRPSVLLADELSLGLAPLVVQRLLQAVRQAADDGVGVVLVEQHVRQALAVADTVHVLRRGRIAMTSAAAEVRHDPDALARHYLSAEGTE